MGLYKQLKTFVSDTLEQHEQTQRIDQAKERLLARWKTKLQEDFPELDEYRAQMLAAKFIRELDIAKLLAERDD